MAHNIQRPWGTPALLLGLLLAACSGGGESSSVEQSRYDADLKLISQARPPGSAHWQKVQDLCRDRFKEHGYTVKLHNYGSGVNVIGTLSGASQAAKQVLVSAHYDHVSNCAGADDNASGVAGLLETARVLATTRHDRTLVVACWDEEERGMKGSRAYVAQAKKDGDQIVLSLVYEMIGYYNDTPNSQQIPQGFDLIYADEVKQLKDDQNRGNFIAAVYDEDSGGNNSKAISVMKTTASDVGLKLLPLKVQASLKKSYAMYNLRRSDHDPFWQQDYPAMMLTDTANFRNLNYHCKAGPDSPERLSGAFAVKTIKTTVAAARRMLQAN